jgi:uncharacterized membrane protein
MADMDRVLRGTLWLALSLLALGGWVALVVVGIHAGRSARDGASGQTWVLVAAVVGAVVLLLLAVAFVRRLLMTFGVVRTYEPKRARRR